MIQLHSDCLVFETSEGLIPCSAEQVVVELVSDSASSLEPDTVRNAAAAILHYFKHELGREYVTVPEFSAALARVLRGFGLEVETVDNAAMAGDRDVSASDVDLRLLACDSGKAFELAFFPRLRDALKRNVGDGCRFVRFIGLRSCVKQLTGARRWNGRCEILSDQIIEYLRQSLSLAGAKTDFAMVVA